MHFQVIPNVIGLTTLLLSLSAWNCSRFMQAPQLNLVIIRGRMLISSTKMKFWRNLWSATNKRVAAAVDEHTLDVSAPDTL